MSICVVGGTGFIGRHLCQALHNNQIKAFSTSRMPNQSFLQLWAPSVTGIPLDDPKIWPLIANTKCAILLGSSTKPGISWRAPDQEIENGVAETARFVRRLLDVNPDCHIVYASSGGTIYGNQQERPFTEDDAVMPLNSYSLGKYLTEQVLSFYSRIDDAKITIVRIANPVGVWQMAGRHGLVAAAVKACRASEEINIYGDGGNIRDYFDADELANALISIANQAKGKLQIFNVSSGCGRSELEIIQLVERTLGKQVKYRFQPAREFDLRYAVLDPQRIAQAYGWRTLLPLEETILKMALSQ